MEVTSSAFHSEACLDEKPCIAWKNSGAESWLCISTSEHLQMQLSSKADESLQNGAVRKLFSGLQMLVLKLFLPAFCRDRCSLTTWSCAGPCWKEMWKWNTSQKSSGMLLSYSSLTICPTRTTRKAPRSRPSATPIGHALSFYASLALIRPEHIHAPNMSCLP